MSGPKVGEVWITRDGRRVHICCDNAPGDYPVVGLILGGDRMAIVCRADGSFGSHHGLDLIGRAPVKRKVWVNFYKLGGCDRYATEKAAREDARNAPSLVGAIEAIAVPVEYEVQE